MFDYDLAELYGVEARALNQAVKRNLERFPADFMFQLTAEEVENVRRLIAQSVTPAPVPAANSSQTATSPRSRSQTVILKRGQNIKYLPYAFTEQGVAILSSVLRSPRAVQVNIAIMPAFVRQRGLLLTNADLARKLADLERKDDSQFKAVFEAIRQLRAPPPPQPPIPEIGFHDKEDPTPYRTRRKPRLPVHPS